VVTLPDNDEPGRKHAAGVSADLLDVGCELRIVEVSKCKDVSDWLAAGGTREDLQRLASVQQPLTGEALEAWRARWEIKTGPATETGKRANHAKAGPGSSAFSLSDNAVVYHDPDPDKEPLCICGRLEVVAVTRDSKGDG
jgi:hypothetical protein